MPYPHRKRLLLLDDPLRFLLRDDFDDTRAAGSVNGTPATPGPGTRTVVDTYTSTEMVLNPGFETAGAAPPAAASWTDAVGTGTIVRTTTAGEFRSGTAGLKITSDAGAGERSYQTITVIPGFTYTYTFWTRGDGTNAGRYRVQDVPGGVDIRSITGTGVTGTDFAQVTYSFVAPVGCTSVRISVYGPPAAGGIAYFDDVSLLPTSGSLSVGSGKSLSNTISMVAYQDPMLYYGTYARTAGRVLLFEMTESGGVNVLTGWRSALGTTSNIKGALYFAASSVLNFWNAGTSTAVGAYSQNTSYKCALVLRANGTFFLLKGGAFTNWTLLWADVNQTATPMFPAFHMFNSASVATIITHDFVRIPLPLWFAVPLASDSFTRANGAMGNTDGLGHAEQNGGGGLAWGSGAATWQISTNKAVNTPVPGVTDYIQNGGFDSDTTNWSNAYATLASVAGGQSGNCLQVTNTTDGSYGRGGQQIDAAATGKWYKIQHYHKNGSKSGIVYLGTSLGSSANYNSGDQADVSWTGRTVTVRGTGALWISLFINSAVSTDTTLFDTVSAKLLTLSELFDTVEVNTADALTDVTLSAYTSGYQGGLVARLDSKDTPANFIIANQNGANVNIVECVGGTYAQLGSYASAYAAGDVLRLDLSGANFRLYKLTSAGVPTLLGAGTTNVLTGSRFGVFSTDSSVSVGNFQCWPKGGGKYDSLDKFTK